MVQNAKDMLAEKETNTRECRPTLTKLISPLAITFTKSALHYGSSYSNTTNIIQGICSLSSLFLWVVMYGSSADMYVKLKQWCAAGAVFLIWDTEVLLPAAC